MTTILEIGSLGTSLGQQNPTHSFVSNLSVVTMTCSNAVGVALACYWQSKAFNGQGVRMIRSVLSVVGVVALMGLRQFFELKRWKGQRASASAMPK